MKKNGDEIITDTGVPQGDCTSALLFILYLAHALKPKQSPEDQGLRKNIITEPHPTSGRQESITLEGQYADGMFTITTNIEEKERLKKRITTTTQEVQSRSKLIQNRRL